MNTGSNAMPMESQAVTPAEIPATHRVYWALRREFWENRSIYLAPLGVAAMFLLGFVISMIRMPEKMRAEAVLDPMKQHAAISMPYDIAAGAMMLTIMVVGAFYSLDALYGERRERSVLFWKSLPVSDSITVLVKASIPIIVLPLVAFVVIVITQLIMLLLSGVMLAGDGLSVTALWTKLSFPRMSFLLLYHLLNGHGLWPAPIYCWLLLVSAWARRAPFLWAFLPPVALCYLEKIAFNSTHILSVLLERFTGTGTDAITPHGSMPMDPMTQLTPLRYLETPGLWIGLVVAAAFLAAAVRLRRYREPI